jgi:peptide/nickel transport system substrate-binding protein
VDANRLQADRSLSTSFAPSYAPYTLQINEAPGRPGTDQAVRQAMLTALDPKAWNQAALGGQGIVSTNFQSNPGGYCYADLSSLMPKPSTSAARQVLLNAGYSAGSDGHMQKNGKTLQITILGSTTTGDGPEYMQSQLEAAGFKTVLNNTDYNTFAATFGRTDYDIVVGLFGATSPAPPGTANFFTGKFPPAGNNRINRDDPQLAQLVADAYAAPPGAAACAAWKAFNTYMIKNWLAFPWVAPKTFWFDKKNAFTYVPVGPTLEVPTLVRQQ